MKNKLNIITVIQARMGSKRLPGKSLKLLLGQPMLERLIDNVHGANLVNKFVVATSDKSIDDDIQDLCMKLNIDCYRGNEKDVLSRFIEVCKIYKADLLVRLTGDNPFVEKSLIDFMLMKYLKDYSDYDYIHNVENSGFPYGLYVEIFTNRALFKANVSKDLLDREHVTRYFKSNKNDFKIGLVKAHRKYKYSHLTVDTNAEFIEAENIFSNLLKNKRKFTHLDL